MLILEFFALLLSARGVSIPPSQEVLDSKASHGSKYFDIQAHRGGRGNTVENTLPSFAWALIDGSTTLELDNGITKDGVVVVWHDEEIVPQKCQDTGPLYHGDPDYPYVGKFVANLTLAQLQTLDCGSLRQNDYPLQLTYPRTRISTLEELFDFVKCADPDHQILWNIESKSDPSLFNRTKSVSEFVERQHEVFESSGYKDSITYQSFDWRTLVEMKFPVFSAKQAYHPTDSSLPSPWLAGINLSSFPGPSSGEKAAQAAHALGVDLFSPSAESFQSPSPDPNIDGYEPFASREMVREAKRLGMGVKVWTVNRLNIVEQVMGWGIDGIVTDYPNVVRRWARQHGLPVAPKYPKQRVLKCLEKHMAFQ
ncbi:PLC-like phosphodiesterase [Phellopilus nigrolimitatus]|nr:PLC-like phosphodiesterase [Phellopilus nigrolimitatus]